MPLSLKLIFVFSAIGVADTLYLIYHMVRKTDVACLFFPKEWCRKVQYSPWSKTLGVPNSVAGLVIYLLILVLGFFYLRGTVPFLSLQIVIGIGFLFSMYFTFIQAFILRAFCTWCVVSAINFIVMTVAAFVL